MERGGSVEAIMDPSLPPFADSLSADPEWPGQHARYLKRNGDLGMDGLALCGHLGGFAWSGADIALSMVR
jgi:hypothetical protein